MESINFRLLDYTKYLLWGMVFTINITSIFCLICKYYLKETNHSLPKRHIYHLYRHHFEYIFL